MSWSTQMTSPSTYTSTSAANKYIQPYLHKVFAWTKHNNLTLNPDKATCTLFTSDTAEYMSNLYLKMNSTTLPMITHPKVLGLTLDPKLTYSIHIHALISCRLDYCNSLLYVIMYKTDRLKKTSESMRAHLDNIAAIEHVIPV